MSKLPNLIYEIVRQIREAFPSVTLMYEYIADSDIHFFKAMPFAISSSREFKEFTADLRLKLLQSGSDLAIGFLSKDSLTQLSECATSFEPVREFQLDFHESIVSPTSETATTSGIPLLRNPSLSYDYALAA